MPLPGNYPGLELIFFLFKSTVSLQVGKISIFKKLSTVATAYQWPCFCPDETLDQKRIVSDPFSNSSLHQELLFLIRSQK